jgi:hypothetical protein
MPENKAVKNNWQFLIEWSILNLVGWIIGLYVSIKVQLNFELDYYAFSSFGKIMLIWFPFGASIGVFQWLRLRRFGINLVAWIFVTSLGFSVLVALLNRAFALNQYGLNLIPRGHVDLGEFIGKIDIGNNIMSLLGGIAIFLGGLIVGGLQTIIIHKTIAQPKLWMKANMLGFLIPAIIMPLAYFFKLLGFNTVYFLLYFWGGFTLVYGTATANIVDIFYIILVITASIGISILTGQVLLQQTILDKVLEAG